MQTIYIRNIIQIQKILLLEESSCPNSRAGSTVEDSSCGFDWRVRNWQLKQIIRQKLKRECKECQRDSWSASCN